MDRGDACAKTVLKVRWSRGGLALNAPKPGFAFLADSRSEPGPREVAASSGPQIARGAGVPILKMGSRIAEMS